MSEELLLRFFTEGARRVASGAEREDVLEWAAKQISILGAAQEVNHILDVPESVEFHEALMVQREVEMNAPNRRVMTWPWPSWNRRLDPLPPGMLMTMAGADGAGKTTYGEYLAEWWAGQKFKVVYFHFELSHAVMMDRRMARHAKLTIRELKEQLNADQRSRYQKANGRIKSWEGNIQYVHCPAWSMEKVTTALRSLHADGKAEVAVIDYLEKAQPSPRQVKLFGNSSFQREADNVEMLKSAAEQLSIPIVMLAQLNKEAKKSEELDRMGIRGAGEKTEKANVVLLLQRKWLEDMGRYDEAVDIRLDKNTLGPTGTWVQGMTPQYFTVTDVLGDTRQRIPLNN